MSWVVLCYYTNILLRHESGESGAQNGNLKTSNEDWKLMEKKEHLENKKAIPPPYALFNKSKQSH